MKHIILTDGNRTSVSELHNVNHCRYEILSMGLVSFARRRAGGIPTQGASRYSCPLPSACTLPPVLARSGSAPTSDVSTLVLPWTSGREGSPIAPGESLRPAGDKARAPDEMAPDRR